MSKKNNVNPDFYKVAGRDRQSEVARDRPRVRPAKDSTATMRRATREADKTAASNRKARGEGSPMTPRPGTSGKVVRAERGGARRK